MKIKLILNLLTVLCGLLCLCNHHVLAQTGSPCLIDLSRSGSTFGLRDSQGVPENTLSIVAIRFEGQFYGVWWQINMATGNWDLGGMGRAPDTGVRIIDFMESDVFWSGCLDMRIEEMRFQGEWFHGRWSLDMGTGNWNLTSLGSGRY